MKGKIPNILSDLLDDIHWWKRNDVSFRFKLMNLVSGDRLRLEMASINHALNQVDETYQLIADLWKDQPDYLDPNDLIPCSIVIEEGYRVALVRMYTKAIHKTVRGIWTI